MILLNAAQARELDRLAMEEAGIPEAALMEAAGLSAVQAMEREWGSLTGRRIALLAGKGSNGGDALVAARHLLNQGAAALVCVAWPKEAMGKAARAQVEILEKLGLKLAWLSRDNAGLKLARGIFDSSEFVVDGLFGTGFKGAAAGFEAALIDTLNGAGRPVVALDLPSGLDADNGSAAGPCVKAALTVTFGTAKRGHLQEPGRTLSGKLVLSDIGIPQSLLSRIPDKAEVLMDAEARSLLPLRLPTAHKKNAGTLLVVAGSAQYPGAAILTARAAQKANASFVRVLAPEPILPLIQAAVPEAVCAAASLEKALEWAKDSHAAVVGPGISNGKEALALARALYERLALPAAFDADALRSLSEGGLPKGGGPRLLTPHEGEFKRLGGDSSDRLQGALEIARKFGVAVLLKGPGTVTATETGRLRVNATGSQALASAGTGDVLAGICGALLAQGLSPLDAGSLGAHLHGLASDLYVSEKGMAGLTASDLIERLPQAFSHLWGKA